MQRRWCTVQSFPGKKREETFATPLAAGASRKNFDGGRRRRREGVVKRVLEKLSVAWHILPTRKRVNTRQSLPYNSKTENIPFFPIRLAGNQTSWIKGETFQLTLLAFRTGRKRRKEEGGFQEEPSFYVSFVENVRRRRRSHVPARIQYTFRTEEERKVFFHWSPFSIGSSFALNFYSLPLVTARHLCSPITCNRYIWM